MASKREIEKSQFGRFRIFLFVIGSVVGVCGSLFGLIATQAVLNTEVFLSIGIFHVVSWGVCGLIVAAGFLGVTTGRRVLFVTVVSGFVGGGVIGALALIFTAQVGVGWGFYEAIAIELLVPPSIGLAIVLRALNVARKRDSSNASCTEGPSPVS